ncbi:MAG: thiamine pyrophosphate-dependent enzyme, partial [Clostridiales bacterium]
SGPGATNLVTGIANAYLDTTPLVAITGNDATPVLGKDSFQEVDIIGITQPIVKHSFLVRDVKDLEGIIKEAFMIASSDRNGPVLIDFPKDMQQALYHYPSDSYRSEYYHRPPEENDYYNAVQAITQSQRPFIYCGGGVVYAGASAEVLALSKKINAPIGMSMMGLSAIPSSYELNMGMTGMHGKYAATMVQDEADLLIAIGVRFSDRATGNVREFAKNCTVIHIDIDPAEINKNIHSRLSLCGDIKQVLGQLIQIIAPKENLDWRECIDNHRIDQALMDPEDHQFSPKNIIGMVQEHCTAKTLVATDVGQHQMWAMQYYRFETPRTLITSGGLGTMGFGLGAAIGGSLAAHKQKTVLFTGDGSLGMNLTELATAVSQQIPLVIIVFNNGVLGMVRQWQTQFYGERYSQTTLHRATNFAQVAT